MYREIRHPLLQHKLTVLRDKDTGWKEFRELASEITMLLAYEAFKELETVDQAIETPICRMTGKRVKNDVVLVPVLRAGVGMLDGMLRLMPTARVGFVGMYRDPETKMPVGYYEKLPEGLEPGKDVILIGDCLKRYRGQGSPFCGGCPPLEPHPLWTITDRQDYTEITEGLRQRMAEDDEYWKVYLAEIVKERSSKNKK